MVKNYGDPVATKKTASKPFSTIKNEKPKLKSSAYVSPLMKKKIVKKPISIPISPVTLVDHGKKKKKSKKDEKKLDNKKVLKSNKKSSIKKYFYCFALIGILLLLIGGAYYFYFLRRFLLISIFLVIVESKYK